MNVLKPHRDPAMSTPPSGVMQKGRNIWRRAMADRFAVLTDGAEYFAQVEAAMSRARRTIWIIGWDFNPDIYLRPDRPSQTLGELLRDCVERQPGLEIRILVWSMGPIYSGKSLRLFRENTWSRHPRIHLRFDSRHPLRGSHHQKMVAIDETIAFLGGIDLTARRWDDSDHCADNPLRVTPDGDTYEPVHDLQSVVTGDAARSIAELSRRRWDRATGETVAAHSPGEDLWPETLEALLSHRQVGFALTEPETSRRKGRREAQALTLDALSSARRRIYIETQYFSFFGVAPCVEDLLSRPDGPEIVVILTRASHGFLEKVIMGGNRDRLIRRLKRRDRHDRLRVLYPVVPDTGTAGEQDVLIHSKLLVIDESFLRLGSSNLNNRSEGLDTEADIAIEADDDAGRTAIAGIRDRLLAEHLDVPPQVFSAAMAATGSMIATIDRLNTRPRGLRRMRVRLDRGETTPVAGTDLVDPRRPFWPLQRVRGAAMRLLGLFL